MKFKQAVVNQILQLIKEKPFLAKKDAIILKKHMIIRLGNFTIEDALKQYELKSGIATLLRSGYNNRNKKYLISEKQFINGKEEKVYFISPIFFIEVVEDYNLIYKSEARVSEEDIIFRKFVFNRDNYTCQLCNKSQCHLHCHHLNAYNTFIEERHLASNGLTLCMECHIEFHNIYGKGNNTKEQFEEFKIKRGV